METRWNNRRNIKYKERWFFNHESDQIQEQVAQRACVIPTTEGAQDLTEHSPEQPDLTEPALSRGLDQIPSVISSNLNYPMILWKQNLTEIVKIMGNHVIGGTGL